MKGQKKFYTGTFLRTLKGYGFVRPDGDRVDADVFIPPGRFNGAMHEDRVKYCLTKVSHNGRVGKRAEGEIVKVLEYGYTEIIGTFQRQKNFGVVVPDDRKVCEDIFIAKKHSLNANTGDKVAVAPLRDKPSNFVSGKVVAVLGPENAPGVDILCILRSHDVPLEFDKKTLAEADSLPDVVCAKDMANREDLRGQTIITMDGANTKDVDDAISIEPTGDGGYRLGVHIADVCHYVRPKSALDKEAYRRGTSIYPVDRVVPMLPKKLSNGICSLNSGEDRFALSCIMDIDKKGAVVKHHIAETIINVKKAVNYDTALCLLTNADSPFLEEYEEYLPMLKQLEALMHILQKKRLRRGAFFFDFSESNIILDAKGRPVLVEPRKRSVTTGIIEECMLVCNETIAEFFFKLEIPFVYRTHEKPDAEKVKEFELFLHTVGYTLSGKGSKAMQKLLSKIEGKPEETVISRMMLRSLKQARYTAECDGHFGLAAKYYCHFTSPIRRYPDLQIHRIIKEYLHGELNQKKQSRYTKVLPTICQHCSKTERMAEALERETEQLKKAEYMQTKIGQEFEGMVTGITSWGVYVELENTIEGLIPQALIQMGCIYNMGDKVKITVERVNLADKTIDFRVH